MDSHPPGGRMSPRSPLLALCALALISLPARAKAPDLDPALAQSPLVRALLDDRSGGAAGGTLPRATTTAPLDPIRALPTALSSLRGSAAHAAPAIPAAFRPQQDSPVPTGGKLPAGEGIVGDNFGAALTTIGDMFADGVSDVA